MFRIVLAAAAVALFAAAPALAQSSNGSMMASGYQMTQTDALASKVIGSPIYSTVALDNGGAAVTSTPTTTPGTATDATAAAPNGNPAATATDTNAQQIGTVRDLVMGTNGTVSALVIGIGGVLGIGEKNVAVAYDEVKWVIASDGSMRGTLDTTADTLKQAPDFQYPASGEATKAGDQTNAAATGNNGAMTTMAPAASKAATPAAVNDPQSFANTAAVSNLFEIQSSQLAQKQATADNLKSFADKMVADHTAAGEQMQTAAHTEKVTVPTALDQLHMQQLSQLQGLSGQQFDQAYTQMQVTAHDDAVALFHAYSQSGQAGALKDFAAKTLPTLQMHQQLIHEIAGK